ncbi:MAG: 30S ribosome-binding factor RbfA [Legionellaceae bacterium]|nr:30S ribosome-binding factor RbfA [Legionellaceae bacterium]
MKPSSKRSVRIAESMQRKLSQIIQQEIRDPRMPKFVTISAVKLSPDKSHAKVYFTILEGDVAEVTYLLNHSSGYLRSVLARTMELRTLPQLHFIYDESIAYARHMSHVLGSVDCGDEDAPAADVSSDES